MLIGIDVCRLFVRLYSELAVSIREYGFVRVKYCVFKGVMSVRIASESFDTKMNRRKVGELR